MNAQQLRNSILQMAIQGKLVPQDPNDEPASVLLERIRKEKEQLVKEGKLKKKDLITTPVTEEDIPFDIPESWEWCKFGDIVSTMMGKTPPRNDSNYWQNGVHNWVAISDMKDYGHIRNTKEFVSEYAAAHAFREKSKAGDLLMSFKLTVGRTSILEIPAYHNEAIITINPYIDDNFAFRNFLFYLLPLIANMGESKDAIKGRTLNSTSIYNLPIPLPPLAEQKRIVAKLEELLPLVEQYGKAQDNLDALNADLPRRLRQSILQQAIQGKLVPQDPNDEPASVLLERIRKEKEQLVKEGKLKKKDLVTTPVAEEEKPFEIPKSWKWCKLGEIAAPIKRGKSPLYVEKSDYLAFAQKCNTKAGYIDLKLAQYFANTKAEQYDFSLMLQKGDIVINSTGNGTLGRVGLFDMDYPAGIKGIIPDSHVTTVHLYKVDSNFAFYYLRTCQPFLESKGEGGTNQKELKPVVIAELYFPLPPLAEQKRIVAKIEELFVAIDKFNAIKL